MQERRTTRNGIPSPARFTGAQDPQREAVRDTAVAVVELREGCLVSPRDERHEGLVARNREAREALNAYEPPSREEDETYQRLNDAVIEAERPLTWKQKLSSDIGLRW